MMTHRRLLCMGMGFTALGLVFGYNAELAHGRTIGLWLFDELTDTTPGQNGGERLKDESVNGLHFTSLVNNAAGSITLTADRPGVMGAGTTAAFVNFGGRDLFATPPTDLFSLGRLGAMTIEFWYKPLLHDTTRFILAFDLFRPNGLSVAQRKPTDPFDPSQFGIPGADFPFQFVWNESTSPVQKSTTHELKSEQIYSTRDGWMHLAGTVDTVSGEGHFYINGQQLQIVRPIDYTQTEPAATPILERSDFDQLIFQPLVERMYLGADAVAGFPGKFLIDELRISDVALLPGNGTGVGELAWNASLANAGVPTFDLGDMNGDGFVNNLDISAFVLALNARPHYVARFPEIDPDVVGDISGNGVLDSSDIDAFAQLLTSNGLTSPAIIPEPGTLGLLAIGGMFAYGRRVRRPARRSTSEVWEVTK